MPPWGWAVLVLLVLIAIPVLKAVRFYRGFRGMCAAVREEMGAFVKSRYPGAEVLREEMGNLIVRAPDGSERLLEMADVYTAVAQLPAMGAEPQARAAIYEQATTALLAPGAEAIRE